MCVYIYITLLFNFNSNIHPVVIIPFHFLIQTSWTAVGLLDPPPPQSDRRKCSDFPWRHVKKSMWGSAIFIPWYPKSEYLELLKSKFINTAGKRINYDTGIDMLPSSKLVTRVAVRILDRHFFMWMFSSGTWKHPRKFRENKGA